MAMLVAWAARAAAFESRTAAVTAAAVWTAAAIAATSAAAEGPLETGTRATADARGVARVIFTTPARIARTRSPGFAGKKNDVFFDSCGSAHRFSRSGRDDFRFGMNVLGFRTFFDIVSARGRLFFFRFVLFFVHSVIVFEFMELAEGGGMFRAFLRDVSGEVRAVGSAVRFHFCDIFRRESGGCFGLNFCDWFRLFFGFHFVFFEDSASDESVCLCVGSSFFVLGFGEVGSESSDLVLTQPVLVDVGRVFVRCLRSSFGFAGSLCRNSRFRFTSSLSQEPAGQPAGKTAGNPRRQERRAQYRQPNGARFLLSPKVLRGTEARQLEAE
jgi:hypothetical protein